MRKAKHQVILKITLQIILYNMLFLKLLTKLTVPDLSGRKNLAITLMKPYCLFCIYYKKLSFPYIAKNVCYYTKQSTVIL